MKFHWASSLLSKWQSTMSGEGDLSVRNPDPRKNVYASAGSFSVASASGERLRARDHGAWSRSADQGGVGTERSPRLRQWSRRASESTGASRSRVPCFRGERWPEAARAFMM